jgi:hypothetical protein
MYHLIQQAKTHIGPITMMAIISAMIIASQDHLVSARTAKVIPFPKNYGSRLVNSTVIHRLVNVSAPTDNNNEGTSSNIPTILIISNGTLPESVSKNGTEEIVDNNETNTTAEEPRQSRYVS